MTTSMAGTNPIVKEHQVGRFTFRSARPVPGGHRVLVWRSASGQVYSVLSPPTTSELMFGSFQVYEVDVAQHPIQITYELPSRDSAMSFHAVLRATWKVTDAAAVVQDGIVNAEAVHDSWLNQLLRDAGSQYSIVDENVERKINNTLAPLVGRCLNGISIIDLRIEISLDEPTSAFVREELQRKRDQLTKLDVAEKDAELARVKADLSVLQAEHDQILQSRQQQYEHELEVKRVEHEKQMTLGEAELTLTLQSKAKQQELALAQAQEKHDLEMKQLRMKFYVEAFQQGNSALILLQLIEHPQDVGGVVHFLLEQRKVAFENSRDMLKALIDADAINPASLDETSRMALGNVLSELRPAVTGLTLPGTETPAITAVEEKAAAPAPATPDKAEDDDPDEYE
jgi:hypothetical protein